MDILNELKTRRSCRSFKDEMITEEELNKVLEAGMYAPTGMGKQSPIIIAITDKEERDKISKENAKIMNVEIDPFYNAPVILLVIANKAIPTYINDGSLVLGNMLNEATSLGLGSIWIHRAKQEIESDYGKELLERLGIEGNYEGIGHCAIGYKKEDDKEPVPRKENYIYKI